MIVQMKDIMPDWVSFRIGEFSTEMMKDKLPSELKNRILDYLNTPQPTTVADMPLIDPVTGKLYTRTNVLREKDGFEWSTAEIYMFEHYNVILTDEFMRLFRE